jgi:hypothetical protein
VDKLLGNEEGWAGFPQLKNIDQGIATHVFAAFHPSLEGKSVPIPPVVQYCLRR